MANELDWGRMTGYHASADGKDSFRRPRFGPRLKSRAILQISNRAWRDFGPAFVLNDRLFTLVDEVKVGSITGKKLKAKLPK